MNQHIFTPVLEREHVIAKEIILVVCNWSNIFDITFHSTLHYKVQNDFYAGS